MDLQVRNQYFQANTQTIQYFPLRKHMQKLCCSKSRIVTSFLMLGMIFQMQRMGLGQASTIAPPTVSPAELTATQIVDNMVQMNVARARALESYQGTRTYTLTYKGFPSDLHAQMVVNIMYTAPDTKHFTVISQSGPKWLQDQVLLRLLKTEKDAQKSNNRRNVDLNQGNYKFSDLTYQPAADGCSYRLTVEPKTNSKYLYRGMVWINDKDFAVCHIEVQPAKSPSFWIKSTTISHYYQKIGDFWLPEKNTSISQIRIGGRATLTILYQNYKILATQPLPSDRSIQHASNHL